MGSIEKVKEIAKTMYQKKFGKGTTINYWGYQQSEYPGTSTKYKNENHNKWNDYYKCLHIQESELQMSATPKALVGFTGKLVTLECKICLSPLQTRQIDSIIWEWAAVNEQNFQPLEFTEYIILNPEDKSLHIYNLKEENTGQYICRLGKSSTAPYFLTVIETSDENMFEVHLPRAPLGPYPREPQNIPKYNLVLDTVWGEWSTCSKCGKIGKMYKLGYCTIIYTKGSNASNEDIKIFQTFKFGIPCDSHIVGLGLKNIIKSVNRKNEIMIAFCKTKCPEAKVFQVKNKRGEVIETANNSEGIYSLAQGLPPIEPPIERRLQYGIKGKNVILECPGNIHGEASILWQIGDKKLIPEKLSEESGGRIYISVTDKVHISRAKIADSNIYSCWQLNELRGAIRLVIEKKIQLNFKHTVMLLGIILILGTLLKVFIRMIATIPHTRNL
ncbi:Ig-like V-type domain-containing protein FAM187A [Cylas formicarius]|uniref:Ig-like V-type domain-containing protein FAM187A n=1 Tax=Cylas formicarius TaxID=197179 RepID=UPI0029585FFF|nr:Ig-like V-type domain-containing protein FAM187A [Cylas formicarius]